MLLNVYGSDGVADKLLASYNPDTDGDDKTVTPAASVDGVRYEAMVRTVTAAEPACVEGSYDEVGDSNNKCAQQFTLDQNTTIYGFSVKLHKNAAADGNVIAHIIKTTAADIDTGQYLLWNKTICGVADLINSTTEYTTITYMLPAPLTVPAGSDYFLILVRSASAGLIHWGQNSTVYAKGSKWNEGSGTWTQWSGDDFWFQILGDGSVCQPEVPTGSGNEVTIDNPRLTLSNVWGTIPAGVETACCLTDATITNTTTGKVLAVKLPTLIDESLVIDCKEKTAILTGNGESVAYAVTWPEGGEFYLAPGANVITYAEPGMTNTDLTLEVRDTWP
jgi:hypothetical protein